MSFFISVNFSFRNNLIIIDPVWLVIFQLIEVSFVFFVFIQCNFFFNVLLPSQDIIWETMVVKSLMKWKSIDLKKSYMPLQQLFIMEIITKSKNVKLRWISSGSMYGNNDHTVIGFCICHSIAWLKKKEMKMYLVLTIFQALC